MTADSRDVRAAVEEARRQSPAREDPTLASVREARVGVPRQVYTSEGEPAYWLVPLRVGDLACGFAHVDLGGHVFRLGAFGSGPEDRSSWIPASFFEQPPRTYLSEIRAAYPGLDVSDAILSYDGSPLRWAWRLVVTRQGTGPAVIYITPAGWYAREAPRPCGSREG